MTGGGVTGGVEFELPKQAWTKPEVNAREHWRVVARRKKLQRSLVAINLSKSVPPKLPVIVKLSRLSAGQLDDDNLAGAMKHVRDEVAEWLGTGDGPNDPVKWKYAQGPGQRGHQWVSIQWRSAP